ncbi:hypothetical protein Tco_1098368 [Tanacetum coccineum]
MCIGLTINMKMIGWGLYEREFSRSNDTSGLLPALQDLFPAAEHRYCVRHIHDNMNLIYKGGNYEELLWKCATATTVVAFERAMDEFKGRLLEARDSHVITALEYVREYFMKKGSDSLEVACIFKMTDNGIEAALPENWVSINELTRKDGTVTCCNYGKKGHNKRSCTGPSVAGSEAASVSQTPRQRQASTSGPASGSQPTRLSQRSPSVFQPQRQTQRHSVAASGSQVTKMTPTRQSQRQKAARMTPTK